MSLQIGIVGLPNVGKSTLFKALTKKQVDASNYPFCTIDPNIGVVAVPDKRLDKLAKIVNPEKIVPTTIEFYDIAGLVKDAHKGEGLGNQFLAHIKETDAIIHLFRTFEDKNVIHVSEKLNPLDDISTIETELILADLSLVEKNLNQAIKQAKSGEPDEIHRRDALQIYFNLLSENKSAKLAKLTKEEKKASKDLQLLTQKPVIFVANVNEDALGAPLPDVIQKQPHLKISAKIESEISELPEKEAKVYLKELGINDSGLNNLIRESYKTLGLITFFTVCPKEVHAWTVKNGSNAKTSAGKIHSDFEDNFIRAEVISYDDFIASGSELAAKEKGLMRVEGKDYIVKNGDIIYFRVGK